MAKKPRGLKRPPYSAGVAKFYGTGLLVFCLFGFWVIGVELRGYLRTADEVTTTARVIHFEVSPGSGRSGPSASAKYEYTWQGQQFRGGKIGFFGYHEGSKARLRSALESGKPIKIYIDPSDPSYSVVDRTWTWNGLAPFSVSLIAAGLGVIHFYRMAVAATLPPDNSRQIRRAERRRLGKETRKKNRQGGDPSGDQGDELG